MIKTINAMCILLSSVSYAYAGSPLTLSGPSPAIPTIIYAGDSSSYTYTITNNTNKTIPVSQTITGNSTSAAISTPCTAVPAAGTCNFVVTIEGAVLDYLLPNGISNTLSVNYAGRLPSKISSSIQTSLDIPAINSLTVTSSATSNTTLANGYVTYTATATTATGVVLDLTPVATWISSQPSIVAVPNLRGEAITYSPSGSSPQTSSTVSASFGGITNAAPALTVNSRLYVSAPVGGNPSRMSPVLYTINPSTGLPELLFNPIPNAYAGITYTAINSDARYIYMANESGNIYSCPLNASTGLYASSQTCSQITINTGGRESRIAVIKLSPNNKFLYALAANGIYTCQVTPATGAVSGCVLQPAISDKARAFAIDPNGLHMYLISDANTSPYVQTCSINPSTGTVSNCVTQSPTGISSTFTTDDLAAVSTTEGTFLYGSAFLAGGGWDGSILVCQADPTTGSIQSCSYPEVDVTGGLLANPTGVSVSSTNTGPLQLYISEGQSGGVNNCIIQSNFNTFGTCTAISTARNNAGILIR